jgi:hypothetical protein
MVLVLKLINQKDPWRDECEMIGQQHMVDNLKFKLLYIIEDRLYGLVVGVPGYRSRGPGSIPSATRFSEK